MVDAPKAGKGLKIPGLGTVPKRTAIIWGGGAVVVIGYALYARHKAKAAGTMALPSTGVDNSGDNTQIDPATGFEAGTSQDRAALRALDKTGGTGGGGTGTTVTNVKPPHTNAEWVTGAANYLHTTSGGTVAANEVPLQKYVNGEAVVQGSKDDTIIHMAIAGIGQPPQSGAGGYPPSIRHSTSGGSQPSFNPKPTPERSFL
jgi:hypothetical protein